MTGTFNRELGVPTLDYKWVKNIQTAAYSNGTSRVLMYKDFSLPCKLYNPYYHSPYLDTTGWRPFNSRPHFVKPSYKPMYSSPPTKPHYNHSRWNFNWLSPLKSLICAKIHTIQSFFRNGRPNRQKPHRKPSYHGI